MNILDKPRSIVDPIYWIENTQLVKGKPFTFKDREYLFPIYRDNSKYVVIKKARQMEITELLKNMILWYATVRPWTTLVYASARADQTIRVSKDRVIPAMKVSQDPKYMDTYVEENAVTRIKFKNESVIYFVSAWGEGDIIRNIPADIIVFDEVQDIAKSAIDTGAEALSHSEIGKVFLVGSPKLANSDFYHMWQESDRKEWMDGKWVPQNNDKPLYSGYHISQMMAPWISPKEIEEKKARYGEQQFINEVLGEFYAGGRVKLTIDQILRCTDTTLGWHPGGITPPEYSYAGIDWGTDSYMTIMGPDMTIYRIMKFPNKDIKFVAQVMSDYNVRTLVCDMGYGDTEVRQLQAIHEDRVLGCYYQAAKDYLVKKDYVKRGDKTPDLSRPLVIADRTKTLDATYDLFYKKKLKIPYRKDMRTEVEWAFSQFLNLFEKFQDATGFASAKKLYEASGPDHAFHSLNYAHIAWMAENQYETEKWIKPPPEDAVDHTKDDDGEFSDWRTHLWG